MKDKIDQAAGKAKETVGKVTGDAETEFKGKAEGLSSKIKEGANDVKDAIKGAAEGIKDTFSKDDDTK